MIIVSASQLIAAARHFFRNSKHHQLSTSQWSGGLVAGRQDLLTAECSNYCGPVSCTIRVFVMFKDEFYSLLIHTDLVTIPDTLHDEIYFDDREDISLRPIAVQHYLVSIASCQEASKLHGTESAHHQLPIPYWLPRNKMVFKSIRLQLSWFSAIQNT